jgi:sulfide:quinone oxidoreductase
MKKVIIVGGGVGGTIIANLLARKFRKDEVQVTLISDSKKHVYLPGCLRIIFGGTSPSSLERDERTLLSKRVNFVLAEAKRINLNERTVEIKDDKAYEYDFLVVATGARYVPSEIPGYSSAALHFYDVQNAQKLAYELSTFKRGRIVIGIASVPYRCPPAPLEFAFLLDEYLRRRGYREKVEIEYLSPVDGVFMIKSVEPVFARLLEERGISYRTFLIRNR